jgi:hypothetical protein
MLVGILTAEVMSGDHVVVDQSAAVVCLAINAEYTVGVVEKMAAICTKVLSSSAIKTHNV